MNEPSINAIKQAQDCHQSGCKCRSNTVTHCPGPSHSNGDHNPSMGVSEKDGKVLVCCYGGCDQSALIVALQERGLWPRKEERDAKPVRSQEPTRIVATYDYQNQDGSLAFQVVRKEGWADGKRKKDFLQRKPNGRGGWDWKKGDTSILYHLPELLAADSSEIIFLPEGEKDADRVAALGLVATTRAEGANKWTDANSAWLTGKRVAILADNDEAGRKDAQRKLQSIQQVAAAVAVVPLKNLPTDGGDVSDWIEAGGSREQLLALAKIALGRVGATETEARAVPTPSLIAFPTDILPASMRGLIESAARSMLVPPEFVAVPLLVLAGATIGNAWEIELKKGWKEGPNLYAAVVGDPGAKKTPALKLALSAIHMIQQRLSADYRARKAAHEEEKALWERTPKKERGAPPEPPSYRHVWTADATTEALAGMLAGSKGLVLVRDELVGWVKSMDAYRSGGKGADRQNYLSMWSRSQIKIDRKSSPEPITVSRPCLSVFGGIQPDVLPDLVEHASRDDGFIDRLLFSYPDIGPDVWTNEGVDEAAQAAVEWTFSYLYDLQGAEMPDGDTVPRVARLDPELVDEQGAWTEWYKANSYEKESDELNSSLKGTWAKMPSQLARLTLILHVVWAADARQPVHGVVPEATLQAAIRLINYFKAHARATFGELRTPRSVIEERVLRGLRDGGPLTTREIHLNILRSSVKYERLKSALDRMLEDGLVTKSDMPKTGKPGRPGHIWASVETADEGKSKSRSTNGPVSFKTQGMR
jgi:hypothetical protein